MQKWIKSQFPDARGLAARLLTFLAGLKTDELGSDYIEDLHLYSVGAFLNIW